MDVSRTLPLDASVGYAKIARQAAAEVSTSQIDNDLRGRLSHILGRDYRNARFAVSDADAKREVGLLEREWGELSQFHQGEDATLDFFRIIQGVPQYSLLIIDEVEASLHPRAQRRLTRFLLWLARHRRIQVILSTHSPYVLEELPPEARVLLLPGPAGLSVVYGVSTELAMTRIDETVHPEVYVFVEDREAAILLREVLASDRIGAGVLLQALEDAMLEPDHHRWNEMVGNVTHKSARSVWEIPANEWSRQVITQADRTTIATAIQSRVAAHHQRV